MEYDWSITTQRCCRKYRYLAAATVRITGREVVVVVRMIWKREERSRWTTRRTREGLADPPHHNTTTCSLRAGALAVLVVFHIGGHSFLPQIQKRCPKKCETIKSSTGCCIL
jgi:hypothetical protein